MTEPVIRLFVSSPSDVSAERQRAAMAADKLNGEFAGRVRIESILWEEHFYSSHTTFQDQIAEAATCDIVIAIFGGRLGTPLPASFPVHRATGQPYPSGTAYEVLSAIEARKSGQDLPDIYVFRFAQSPAVRLEDPNRSVIEAQWTALKTFFDTWFHRQGGEFIAAFHEYTATDDFAAQVEACLRQFLARHGFVTQAPVWDRLAKGSPFPGLAAFEADRRAVFFGRDRAIALALDRLRRAGSQPGRLPFLLVIGASGSGKSSLLRAGLLPRLITPGVVPEVDLWRTVLIVAGRDPFAALAESLFAALKTELSGGPFATPGLLARQLAADPDLALAPIRAALALAARERQSRAKFDSPRPARLALGVDQVERLFTETDPDVALRFASLLARLVQDGLATIIMALRGDFYPRFQATPPLLALRDAGDSFDLVPPADDELEQIIRGPVDACDPPLAFAPDLAARLAREARGGDALPLLQIALARLYEAQELRNDGILSQADYQGMDAAVTATADLALQGLPDSTETLSALVAAMVSDVTTDPKTGQPVATIVPLDRAAFTRNNPTRDLFLDAFIDRRLLTADGDGAHITVRPTHEALLRIWPAAVALVKELDPLLRARRALAPLVRDWQSAPEAAKPRHLEISPALLEEAHKLPTKLDVEAPMVEFIAACASAFAARQRQEEEDRNRRLRDAEALAAARRRTARIAGAGLVAALLLAGAAAWQWREAGNQRDIASTQRDRAEQALTSATDAANSLVFDLAQKFHNAGSVPVAVVMDILNRATQLQTQLLSQGSPTPALRRSQAAALDEKSSTLLDQGQTPGALDAAEQAQAIFQGLVDAQPTDTDLQRDLSVSLEKIGDVQVAQGNLPEALKSYQASLAIRDRLAKSDPGNAGWQRDLSVSFNKVGDVQVAQGNLPEALKSYQASLAIRDRLAKSDPGNAGWQRDLSVSFNKVGDVQVAQGNLPEALKSYQASLAIRDRLAKSDPGNAGWQRDLSVSFDNVGDVQVAQGNLPEALKSYQASLAIRDRLAKSDPGNAGWQRDLSVSFDNVGDVQVAQGNLPEALKSYQASLAIRDRLAKSDPGNAGWQRDLSVSFDNVGDVQVAQGNLPEALKSYQASLAIRDRLAKSDPGNAGWQRDLSVSFEKVGNVQVAQGNLPEALKSYQAYLVIADRLAKSDPGNAGWQRDLAVSYSRLGTILIQNKHPAEARAALMSGRQIIAHLLEKFPDYPQWNKDRAWFDSNIAAIPADPLAPR